MASILLLSRLIQDNNDTCKMWAAYVCTIVETFLLLAFDFKPEKREDEEKMFLRCLQSGMF